jgi:hypothetical protein
MYTQLVTSPSPQPPLPSTYIKLPPPSPPSLTLNSPKLDADRLVTGENGVPGWATYGEVQYLRNALLQNKSMQNDLINQTQGPGLASSAYLTYVRGEGGTFTLPKNALISSDGYYTRPTRQITTSLLDRAFQGYSATPSTKNITARMAMMKPGESIRISDYQNQLIKMSSSDAANRSRSDQQLWGTLGDITLNTNANITIRYDGPKHGYTMTVDSTHTYLDTYNWNAKRGDDQGATNVVTTMPGGKYGKINLNHADQDAMQLFGAKNFQIVAVAKQTSVYKIPAHLILPDPQRPFHVPNRAELGSERFSMDKLRVGRSTNIEIREPAQVRAAVKRAGAQSPRSNVILPPNVTVKEFLIVPLHANPTDKPKVDPKAAEIVEKRQRATLEKLLNPADPTGRL